MDDEMLAVASQQTLSLFITEEQLVLEQAAVVCCLALVTCECHWLSKLYNTFVGTGRDGSLQQFSSLPLLLRLAVKKRWNFNFSKINRLFTLAKGGLGSCNKLVERQSSEEELLVH
eukprot:Em0002g898a